MKFINTIIQIKIYNPVFEQSLKQIKMEAQFRTPPPEEYLYNRDNNRDRYYRGHRDIYEQEHRNHYDGESRTYYHDKATNRNYYGGEPNYYNGSSKPLNENSIKKDVPNDGTIYILKVLEKYKELSNLSKLIKSILQLYENEEMDHDIVSAIQGVVDYLFQGRGYYPLRKVKKYKLKFMGKSTTWTCYFNNENKIEEKHDEIDVIKICTYDVSGLNDLAQLLAAGASMTQKLIGNRLMLLEREDFQFKYNEPLSEGTTTAGCVKNILSDLVCYWKFSHDLGYSKLTRYFLLGVLIMNHHDELIKAKRKKVNKKSNSKDSKESDFVYKNNKIVSSCITSIATSKDIQEIFDDIVEEMTNDLTQDFISKTTKQNLVKEMKKEMKVSCMLFYFVNVFGFIALISTPIPTHNYLLQRINFKKIDEITGQFEILRKKVLGNHIIEKNNLYSDEIINSILNCSKRLQIYTEALENSLTTIKDGYTFRKHCSSYINSTDQTLNNINNNVKNIHNMNSAINNIELIKNSIETTLQQQTFPINYHKEDKTQFSKSNPLGTLRPKDIQINNPLSNESKKGIDEEMGIFNSIITEDQKTRITAYAVTDKDKILKKYNININTLSEADANYLSTRYAFWEFVDQTGLQIPTQDQIENANRMVNDFIVDLNTDGIQIFDDAVANRLKLVTNNYFTAAHNTILAQDYIAQEFKNNDTKWFDKYSKADDMEDDL